MQRNRQPERGDEPEVTFELEETPRAQRRSRMSAAGAAAVAGAGLASSAAASDSDESLDVFEQLDDDAGQAGGVPITSFQELTETDDDAEFPPLDFLTSDAAHAGAEVEAGTDSMFGATADVGGGFVLDATAGDAAFGASNDDLEPVADSLIDDGDLDESMSTEADAPDDFDLP